MRARARAQLVCLCVCYNCSTRVKTRAVLRVSAGLCRFFNNNAIGGTLPESLSVLTAMVDLYAGLAAPVPMLLQCSRLFFLLVLMCACAGVCGCCVCACVRVCVFARVCACACGVRVCACVQHRLAT